MVWFFPIWKASHFKAKKPNHNRLKILLSNDFDKQKEKADFADYFIEDATNGWLSQFGGCTEQIGNGWPQEKFK